MSNFIQNPICVTNDWSQLGSLIHVAENVYGMASSTCVITASKLNNIYLSCLFLANQNRSTWRNVLYTKYLYTACEQLNAYLKYKTPNLDPLTLYIILLAQGRVTKKLQRGLNKSGITFI